MVYNYKSKYNIISKISPEKYHSLAAYAIYLIVPGCESLLELKRCSEAARGQLHKGSQALHLPWHLPPVEVNSSQIQPNPSRDPALSYLAALTETSVLGCTAPALYRQRVKCVRSGIVDLTRDQPKGAKEILGWGRAKITVKGRWELSGEGHLLEGRAFPQEKGEKEKVLLRPEGWNMYLGLEEAVQALIPAPPDWSKPYSEGSGLTVLLSFRPRTQEAARKAALQKNPVYLYFFKSPLKALENGSVRLRGTRMQIQEVSAADLNALHRRSTLCKDKEQQSG